MPTMIQPGATFKDNLMQLPPIDQVQRIDLIDGNSCVVASIENQPGKQGYLAFYQYLKRIFDTLDAKAAEHGLAVFGEHTADARNRPGAHPNVDRHYTTFTRVTPVSRQTHHPHFLRHPNSLDMLRTRPPFYAFMLSW